MTVLRCQPFLHRWRNKKMWHWLQEYSLIRKRESFHFILAVEPAMPQERPETHLPRLPTSLPRHRGLPPDWGLPSSSNCRPCRFRSSRCLTSLMRDWVAALDTYAVIPLLVYQRLSQWYSQEIDWRPNIRRVRRISLWRGRDPHAHPPAVSQHAKVKASRRVPPAVLLML